MKALVVEDNEADAVLIETAFQECGSHCELTFVQSKTEAEGLVVATGFDLILMDFGSSYSDAHNFVRAIRSSAPAMPIIVLSGYADPTPAYEAGANALVPKTADIQQFFDNVQGIMRFWTDVAQLPRRTKHDNPRVGSHVHSVSSGS